MGTEEFDEFYRATARRLLQYTLALCGDLNTAADLTQETYVRAWQHWPTVRRYEYPEGWLRLVAGRLCTDRWRRLAVNRRLHARLRPPDPVAPPTEDTVLLVAAMRRLPVNLRRALALHYLLDRSIAEIAQETGAAPGTVKSWLARGRSALAGLIDTSTTPTTPTR